MSSATKNKALREIIDKHLSVMENALKERIITQEQYDKFYSPMLDRVIKGETTFVAEYERLGPGILKEQGSVSVFGGNFDTGKEVQNLDEAVHRAYHVHKEPMPF